MKNIVNVGVSCQFSGDNSYRQQVISYYATNYTIFTGGKRRSLSLCTYIDMSTYHLLLDKIVFVNPFRVVEIGKNMKATLTRTNYQNNLSRIEYRQPYLYVPNSKMSISTLAVENGYHQVSATVYSIQANFTLFYFFSF